MTIQDKLKMALLARGFVVSIEQPRGKGNTKTYSRKYIRMEKGKTVLWLGKSGSLRVGRNVSASRAVTDKNKKGLLAEVL